MSPFRPDPHVDRPSRRRAVIAESLVPLTFEAPYRVELVLFPFM